MKRLNITKEQIRTNFPIKNPYCFMDDILEVDANHIIAYYTFKEDEFFFKGHFPGNPVVPGAILQEAAAQIGLLSFGIYLLGNGLETLSELPIELPSDIKSINISEIDSIREQLNHVFYLSSSKMDFKNIVRPGNKIFVHAEKVFFRLNKLKVNVSIRHENDQLVSKGQLSGIVINSKEK